MRLAGDEWQLGCTSPKILRLLPAYVVESIELVVRL